LRQESYPIEKSSRSFIHRPRWDKQPSCLRELFDTAGTILKCLANNFQIVNESCPQNTALVANLLLPLPALLPRVEQKRDNDTGKSDEPND